jgi:hypothetical protein
MNLRAQIETDLEQTLEDPNGFGLPVVLVAPDGTVYDKSANDPDVDLCGQVLYDSKRVDPETGLDIIIHQPVVTLRRSSLTRVPVAGEKWAVKIPITPNPDADKVTHALERAPEDGGSIGFLRLYLTKAVQA